MAATDIFIPVLHHLPGCKIIPPLEELYRKQRGVIWPDGAWSPLLSEKGYTYYNSKKRFKLAAGSRKSTKTITCCNTFLRHLWENDAAVGGVIAKTLGNAKEGPWNDLVNFALPGWCESGIGMKILDGPRLEPSTKMVYVVVSNMHGGQSTIQLHSLNVEPEVEKKFMARRFSIIWMSQAEQFEEKSTLNVLADQLRIIGIPYENHCFLLDANPPENGSDHFLHDVFIKAADPASEHHIKNHSENYEVLEFGLDDNPFLDPREREEIEDRYKNDPVKHDRFIKGKWVKDSAIGIYDDVFLPNIHIIGKAEGSDKSKWETIVPAQVPVLGLSLDIGESNHSASFVCPRVGENGTINYDVFDECVCIETKMSVRDFAQMVYDRKKFWDTWFAAKYSCKPPMWRCWADSSLMNYSATGDTNDAQIFFDVSNGEIRPRTGKGQKSSGSIKASVAMVRRLFFENRLFFSAHCFWHIRFARFLKKGKAKTEAIMAGQQERHTHDSCRYFIAAECPMEMSRDRTSSTSTGVISI